jgi:hypothetical protein
VNARVSTGWPSSFPSAGKPNSLVANGFAYSRLPSGSVTTRAADIWLRMVPDGR